MRIDGDVVKFRSGRREYANLGIIGINSTGDVSGGYDDGFGGDNDVAMSQKERVELAEHMINLWKLFAIKEAV